MKTYLVGGAVRDTLLGLPITERDWVVVGESPAVMLNAGFKPVGKDFPVFLHPQTGEEYALARLERKIAKGYHGFLCDAAPTVTLEEDLARRDLTINAMAQDTAGHITDPYGGREDLKHRLLRHVSPAFVEDPLRVLRVARFAARFAGIGFTVAPETEQLMTEMVQSGELQALTPERVWREMEKALGEASPEVFFTVLRSVGALSLLMPSLNKLWGVPQDATWHPEIDTGIHTLMVLNRAVQLTTDKTIRFAALCHDLGKGETPQALWPKHTGHEERGVLLIKALCAQYRVPRAYGDLACLVSRYHGDCHRALTASAEDLLGLLESLDAFRRPARLTGFLTACQADFQGRLGYETAEYAQGQRVLAAFERARVVKLPSVAGMSAVEIQHQLRTLRVAAISGG